MILRNIMLCLKDYATREDSEKFYQNATGVLGGKTTIVERVKEAKADRAIMKDAMRLQKRPAEVRIYI